MRTLLIGGARSGKSTLAARQAQASARSVCCIVTALASDAEMTARIAAHRAARPAHWRVREEPVRLGDALREEARSNELLLVDCLTLWSANCLWPLLPASSEAEHPADFERWRAERDSFLAALRECARPVILVTNEVGSGMMPVSAAGRVFCDEHGALNQAVAAECERVLLVSAGLALPLK